VCAKRDAKAACLADLGGGPPGVRDPAHPGPLQLAARSAIFVAVSPVLFVASGIHGDPLAVAVALLLLAMYLLVDKEARWSPASPWRTRPESSR
jgi:hypothetical protein